MKLEIDDELKGCALVALRDAFWWEYSEMVLRYADAVRGLGDADEFRYGDLSDISNVASIDESNSFDLMDIEHHLCPEFGGISHPDTLAEALQMKGHAIYINNRQCFGWDDKIGWVVHREP